MCAVAFSVASNMDMTLLHGRLRYMNVSLDIIDLGDYFHKYQQNVNYRCIATD